MKSREDWIIEALKNSKYGLTAKEIAKKTNMSLMATRICLSVLRKQKIVTWFADWYGKNEGYKRIYRLKEVKNEMLGM